MYESDTDEEKNPGLAARILSALAAITFAGGALWIGLSGGDSDQPLNAPRRTAQRRALPVHIEGLEITAGPRIVRDPSGRYIEWSTNEPSDSLVVVETGEAQLRTLVKDPTRHVTHRFELPEMPFLSLRRIEVKSASESGEYVGAEIGPGGGGRWETLEDVTDTHGAAALAPTQTLTWGEFDGDGRPDAAVCDAGPDRSELAVWGVRSGADRLQAFAGSRRRICNHCVGSHERRRTAGPGAGRG